MLRNLMLAAAMSLAAAAAQAATINWTAELAGTQEVPAVSTAATGLASGTIDTVTGLLGWEIEWSGITSSVLGLHFHAAALPGANAGVVVNIGLLTGLGTPNVGSTTISAALVAALLDGHFYINLHTLDHPSGEIRGQVNPVPVPLPAAMLISGLGLLVLLRRRRSTRA